MFDAIKILNVYYHVHLSRLSVILPANKLDVTKHKTITQNECWGVRLWKHLYDAGIKSIFDVYFDK